MRNKIPLKLISLYQNSIDPNSPIRCRCRFTPTCSHYAKGCYEKFNFFKASFLTAKRLLKCNPLFKPGYDPVPLTKEEKQQILEEQKSLEKN